MFSSISYFIFYDYETFGLVSTLDKIVQFSCIVTNNNFIPVFSKVFFCYPSIDYLPNPNSILITKILPQFCYKHGINEYFFASNIFHLFNKKKICIIGYNNIFFDDIFTQQLFYRNGFDPYAWSWKNNNFTIDLLIILRAFYIFSPESLKWPKDEFGNVIFKLTSITSYNNILHTKAHDASSDVLATFLIFKKLYKKNKKLLLFFMKKRKKKNILYFLSLHNRKPFFYVSNIFGSKYNNISCIYFLFFHPLNSNIGVFFNLRKNPSNLWNILNSFSIYEKSIKSLIKAGLSFFYLNKFPIFMPYNSLSIQSCKKLKIDYLLCQKNFFSFQKRNIHDIIRNILCKNVITRKNKDVDCQLYDNFLKNKDIITFRKLHFSYFFLKNLNSPFFQDKRLSNIFFRIKARNFFYLLNYEEKKKWKKHCLNIFSNKNFYKYINEIILLKKKHSNPNNFLLSKLLDYVNYINSFIYCL